MANATYPGLWGSSFWKMIHLSAKRLDLMREYDAKHPDKPVYTEKRQILRNLLNTLDTLLPCDTCSVNYLRFVLERPVPEDGLWKEGDAVFWMWTVDLHNHANGVTNKRQVSYEEAEQYYQEMFDYSKAKDMSDAQLARMQDTNLITNLRYEIEGLKRWGTKPAATTIVTIAFLTALVILLLMFAIYMVWFRRSTVI